MNLSLLVSFYVYISVICLAQSNSTCIKYYSNEITKYSYHFSNSDVLSDYQQPSTKNMYRFEPTPYRYEEDIATSPLAFIVGGVNSNELISQIPTLTGVTFDVLNLRARPSDGGTYSRTKEDLKLFPDFVHHSTHVRRSYAGWLASDIPLREQLLIDNTYVLSQGFTHQVIAKPLLRIMGTIESNKESTFTSSKPIVININENNYEIKVRKMEQSIFAKPKHQGSGWRQNSEEAKYDTQASFFNDHLSTTYYFEIKDVKTEKTLIVDGLTPHLIYRYGFYQGGPYRIAPQKIIEFFSLNPNNDLNYTHKKKWFQTVIDFTKKLI